MKKRVVVTGMGVVTPIGVGVKTFWENVVRGVSGVDYIQAFDAEGFPTTIGAEVKGLDLDEWFTPKEKTGWKLLHSMRSWLPGKLSPRQNWTCVN